MIGGMLGKKIGMTQIFRQDGRVVPVTAIQAGPCTVTQIKTNGTDGYEAVQVGFDPVKRLNKALRGHLGRNGLFRFLREFPVDSLEGIQVGQADRGGPVFSRGPGERDRDLQGAGLPGRHEAPRLSRRPSDPRPVGQGPCPGLHRRHYLPGQGAQGKEDGRAHGKRQGHGEEPRGGGGGPGEEPHPAEGAGSPVLPTDC